MERGRLDAQLDAGELGDVARPGGAPVGVERRQPGRLGRPEARRIEVRGGEERTPVGLLSVGRGHGGQLWRHVQIVQQASRGVEPNRGHAAGVGRRVAPGDDLGLVDQRHQIAGALPVPVAQKRRPTALDHLPTMLGRHLLAFQPLQGVAVVAEALGPAHSRLRRGPERRQHLLGPVGEHVARQLVRHLRRQLAAVGERHEDQRQQREARQQGDRPRRR